MCTHLSMTLLLDALWAVCWTRFRGSSPSRNFLRRSKKLMDIRKLLVLESIFASRLIPSLPVIQNGSQRLRQAVASEDFSSLVRKDDPSSPPLSRYTVSLLNGHPTAAIKASRV